MKKGQMNIDFVISMTVFIGAFFIYIYNIAGTTAQHLDSIQTLEFETECLAISNALMDKLTGTGFSLNETYYTQVIRDCELPNGALSQAKYQQLKSDVKARDNRELRVILTQFLVAPTTQTTYEGYHLGKLEYGGEVYSLAVFNSTPTGIFDRFNISGSSLPNPLTNRKEGDVFQFDGQKFVVKRIDPAGNFVLFYRTMARCGVRIGLEEKHARYSFFERYRGHLVRVDVLCK